MDKYVKKYLSKDEAEFLSGAESPWKSDYSGASESGTYQSRRFDDNTGHFRGANWDDSESHDLRNKPADEGMDPVHQKLSRLIDGQEDMPPVSG